MSSRSAVWAGVAAAFIMLGSLSRADLITIGSDTLSATNYPFDNFYENNRSQMLYLASEIGSPCVIQRIGFDISVVGHEPRDFVNFEIRLMEVSQDNFNSETDFLDVSGATLVFSANPYPMPTTTGWHMWDINDFTYSGESNLLVEIRWGDNGSYATWFSYDVNSTDTSPDYRVLWGSDDNITPPPFDDKSYKRPNLQLDVAAIPEPATMGYMFTGLVLLGGGVGGWRRQIRRFGRKQSAHQASARMARMGGMRP